MKKIILLVALFPAMVYAQKKPIDTITSKTKIYAALNATNTFSKRDEYDIRDLGKLDFKAIIVHDLTTDTTVKGAKVYATNAGFFGVYAFETFFDDSEITDIIKCLKYIIDSVNLEKSPNHDQWFYYRSIDNFEIGAKAPKNGNFKIYLKQNYRLIQDQEKMMSRKELEEVYSSFVVVGDFLKKL